MLRYKIALASLFLALIAPAVMAGDVPWKKHDINAKSVFEGAAALDADGDGKLDIVSGDTWYNAPDWTPYPVRKLEPVGRTYRNCFATMPMDVNGDGKMDYVTVSYFGKNVGWVENPGVKGQEWTYHEIDTPGPSEAAVLVDVDGDGQLDVLPNTVNVVVWYSPGALSLNGDQPTRVWKKHDFGTAAAGHGVGTGDINGDGRSDLLTPKGWFEAPSDPSNDSWAFHPDWDLGTTGIQILARDVDGDGLSDLIYGMGHAFGLYWQKQGKGTNGERTWTKAPIDESFSSVHTLLWADLDGDGKANEMITGKRVYAHEIEAGDVEAPVIAYFTFDTSAGKWDRHLIYQGEAAKDAPKDGSNRDAQKDFPPGTAGTGLEVSAVDIDKDGDIDLVCPGKSGIYLFENLTRSK
ncbi:FG-GAP repeat domain-containing protein [Tundrisphaera lichenicola]|uniref:FG-GAP repeat domain-containing protein n=1 Tax=Tundrisphaera lichenicola TaxID=2029860 RepID=UPI003EB7DB20